MAGPTWTEHYEGWSLGDGTGQQTFTGKGGDTTDLALVKASFTLVAPTSFGGVSLSSLEVDEIGYKLWRGTARYGKSGGSPPKPETGATLLRISTAGGTQHITQAVEHIDDFVKSGEGTAPNYKGVIGVDQDGNIAGTDIPMAAFEFEVTRYVADEDVSNAYIGALAENSGKANSTYCTITADGKTLGFEAESCVYLGSTIARRQPEGDWEVVSRFMAAPPGEQTIGDITFTKAGVHYMWVLYKPDVNKIEGYNFMKPSSVHIERVFKTFDFSDLEP